MQSHDGDEGYRDRAPVSMRRRGRGSIGAMSDAFEGSLPPTALPDAATPPVPVRPLAYFDAPDEGWTAATRLVLAFTAIYAGARVFGGVAYLMLTLGQSPARYPLAMAALLTFAQSVLPLSVLAASLAALNVRNPATRVALIWCAGIWIVASLTLPLLSVLQMLGSFPRSMAPVARAGYYLNTLIGAVGSAVTPAMTIVLLTRPPVRRLFGGMM
jgi:hypothetical protein